MALVVCKECGKEISSSATTCPHCGKVRRLTPGQLVWSGLLLLMLGPPLVFVAFLICIAILAAFTP